jgi:lysozyme
VEQLRKFEMQRTINVIDMYHGNVVRTQDFSALRTNGIMAIIHKASQGLRYRDPAYAARRDAAQAAGLLWGAYHFLDATDPIAQADLFLEAAGIAAPNSGPILLACDFENSSSQPTLKQCAAFMGEVDRNSPPGVSCVLYSGNLVRETLKPHPGGHQASDMQGIENFFQMHRLWLAEYGPKEQIPWPWNMPIAKSSNEAASMPAPGVWLWQYTERGRVNPLTGNTDGNFFDGVFEDLKARWLA